MKKALVLGLLYTAFVVGAIATCLFGHAGVRRLGALRSEVRALEANIAALKGINAELSDKLERLRSDPETVSVLARELGYVRSGEHRIELESFDPERDPPRAGFVIEPQSLDADDAPRRETVYLIPLVLLFLALSVELGRAGRDAARH